MHFESSSDRKLRLGCPRLDLIGQPILSTTTTVKSRPTQSTYMIATSVKYIDVRRREGDEWPTPFTTLVTTKQQGPT